ncbi:hypothetical protein CDIK_3133 [Cucumispora dikerogammari]|nr:hypothetical protein CDIK_3133 [Cucumispora dikerogammari]
MKSKKNIVSFLITNSTPVEMSSLEKSRFLKKARGFVLEEGKLHILVNGVGLEYVCEFEVERIIQICNSFYLPEHLGRNALREVILTRYIGVGVKQIYDYVDGCVGCQREAQHVPSTPLTPIKPNFIRERLIVDTIDLSEYYESNNGIR